MKRDAILVTKVLHDIVMQPCQDMIIDLFLIQYHPHHKLQNIDFITNDYASNDLSILYTMYSTFSSGKEKIGCAIATQVTLYASKIVTNYTETTRALKVIPYTIQNQFIAALCLLQNTVMEMLKTSMEKDIVVSKAFHTAFERVLSSSCGSENLSQTLSYVVDVLLKKPYDDEKELLLRMDEILLLFVYLIEKDYFIEYYQVALGKRMLAKHRIFHWEIERSFVGKLKEAYGWKYTSKVECMLKDYTLATMYTSEFQEYCKKQVKDAEFKTSKPKSDNEETTTPMMAAQSRIDFSITLLTSGMWPGFELCHPIVPLEMMKCITQFYDYFSSVKPRRKIDYLYDEGEVVLSTYSPHRFDLVLVPLQAVVLLQFNASCPISFQEVR